MSVDRHRRRALGALATLAGSAALPISTSAAEAVRYPVVQPGKPLVFPRDHGAHPAHRIEWWYVTGWLDPREGGGPLGVQITFFRLRPGIDESPALFAPRQLLFAHAALADPAEGRLLHDERAARAGLGLASASESTTDVAIGDWRFALEAPTRYVTRIPTRAFTLELAFEARTPILLQGEAGYSRKGPQPQQASYYYSRPHLAVAGRVTRGDRSRAVGGVAWLDHEWSSEVMAPDAQGWDWIGINFDDGSALMAFRMRSRSGGLVWSAATLRTADGRVRTFRPDEIRFEALRTWASPRTNAKYPVAMRVTVGDRVVTLAPLFDDQELDSRASTGTVYWEGAVRAFADSSSGAGTDTPPIGRGYLELTGYQRRLVL